MLKKFCIKINALSEIKNVEIIKYKKHTPGHKKLLNLFNKLLIIILTDKRLESENQEHKNENEKVESRKEENEDEDYENENDSENEDDDDEDDDEIIKILLKSNEYGETVDQNKKNIRRKNHLKSK